MSKLPPPLPHAEPFSSNIQLLRPISNRPLSRTSTNELIRQEVEGFADAEPFDPPLTPTSDTDNFRRMESNESFSSDIDNFRQPLEPVELRPPIAYLDEIAIDDKIQLSDDLNPFGSLSKLAPDNKIRRTGSAQFLIEGSPEEEDLEMIQMSLLVSQPNEEPEKVCPLIIGIPVGVQIMDILPDELAIEPEIQVDTGFVIPLIIEEAKPEEEEEANEDQDIDQTEEEIADNEDQNNEEEESTRPINNGDHLSSEKESPPIDQKVSSSDVSQKIDTPIVINEKEKQDEEEKIEHHEEEEDKVEHPEEEEKVENEEEKIDTPIVINEKEEQVEEEEEEKIEHHAEEEDQEIIDDLISPKKEKTEGEEEEEDKEKHSSSSSSSSSSDSFNDELKVVEREVELEAHEFEETILPPIRKLRKRFTVKNGKVVRKAPLAEAPQLEPEPPIVSQELVELAQAEIELEPIEKAEYPVYEYRSIEEIEQDHE